ncbi:Arylacetamide deacetylase [Cytospora mali]|uniref:Arylacetamide deacetylase n=1 Tax=Cytospora mali TaxID=578113 RepID=A0A194VXN4_CYTMA|nr:Arylacetamide deacetylase [Valsa mali]
MKDHVDLYTSSPSWEAYLADPNSGAAGASLEFDAAADYPWEQNRQDRKAMEAAWSKEFPPSKYGYQREQMDVEMRDGSTIPVMIYRPEGQRAVQERLPLVFNTHGGGWYQGSTVTDEIFLLRVIMSGFQVVIVSPEYRLVPEHPFPTPLDDCWDTLIWALKNDGLLGFDPHNVLLAASSAGGSLTAALGVRLGNIAAGKAGVGDYAGISSGGLQIVLKHDPEVRKNGQAPLTSSNGTVVTVKGVLLNVPITCHPDFLPPDEEYPNTSYAEARAGTTLLCSEEMRKIWALYAGEPIPSSSVHPGSNPDMSPLLADLQHFPPSRIYVAGQDPLRDEAVAFATKLRRASRQVEIVMYPGVPHVFGAFDDLMETKQFWVDCKAGIKALTGWS